MSLQEVTYNGQTITYARVSFSGRAVYDSTDRSFQGYEMSFDIRGLLVGDPSDKEATTTQDFQTEMTRKINALSQPRQFFTWTVNGQTVWNIAPDAGLAPQPSAYEDRRWGPKPRNIRVREVTGGISATIEMTIDAFITPCASGSEPRVVDEFWWQFNYSFDQNYTCTRTITGRYRTIDGVDSPAIFLADETIWPGIPRGFFRQSINHTTSPDGTQIDWVITDQQVWRTLPRPLTSGSATFSLEQRGAALFRTLQGSFEAPINIRKQVIYQFVSALIEARMADAFKSPGEGGIRGFITNFSITNHEFANRIDFSVTMRSSAKELLQAGTAIFQAGLMTNVLDDIADLEPQDYPVPGAGPNGSDLPAEWSQVDGKAYNLRVTGSAGLIPQIAEPLSVCASSSLGMGNTSQFEGGDPEDNAPTPEPGDGPVLAGSKFYESNNSFSEEQFEFPYVSFYEHWEFICTHNLKVLQVLDDEATDVVQRTAPPQVRVLQIGHARRLGKPPTVPIPAQFDLGTSSPAVDAAVVEQESIRTSAPQVIGDGRTLEFQTNWSYSIVLPSNRGLQANFYRDSGITVPDDTNNPTNVYFPQNPQLADEIQTRLNGDFNTADISKQLKYDGAYGPQEADPPLNPTPSV